VVEDLKQSGQHLREMAKAYPGTFGSELLALADQIAAESRGSKSS
jgi:hypothetical protein